MCNNSGAPVTLVNKIGGFFSIPVPKSLRVEHIHFDFSDSLLSYPNSPICSGSKLFCIYNAATRDLLSTDPEECPCSLPHLDGIECTLKPQIALFPVRYPQDINQPISRSL